MELLYEPYDRFIVWQSPNVLPILKKQKYEYADYQANCGNMQLLFR